MAVSAAEEAVDWRELTRPGAGLVLEVPLKGVCWSTPVPTNCCRRVSGGRRIKDVGYTDLGSIDGVGYDLFGLGDVAGTGGFGVLDVLLAFCDCFLCLLACLGFELVGGGAEVGFGVL